jgi:division/cell wall cluster transcriptional repressor MraZ
MVTRRTKLGWMALGGTLCLFGVVAAFKLRDGNQAIGSGPPLVKKEVAGPSKPPAPDVAKTQPADPPAPAPLAPPSAPPAAPEEKLSKPDVPPPGPNDPPAAPPSAGPPPAAGINPPDAGAAPMTPPPPPPMPTPGAGSIPSPPPPADTAPPPGPPAPPPAEEKPASPPTTRGEALSHPGEPPLAPNPGPVQEYKVRGAGETFKGIAKKTLGTAERWADIHKLNPSYPADASIPGGTLLRIPGDACVQEEAEPVKPLPSLRPRGTAKAKVVLPLTGTFPVNLDDRKVMTLPRQVREQLGSPETVLISPGPDKCLWLTNHAHLERLAQRLDQSPAREADVRVFKRLYYAQTVKTAVNKEGRVAIAENLAAFAGLDQEVVLVGIDDHFEVWDAARWRRYTQARGAKSDHD